MGMTFWGHEHAKLNARLLEVLAQCKLKAKLVKKFDRRKVPLKIKGYPFMLVFAPPAKVINIDYTKLVVDISMQTNLFALDEHYPDGGGKATVRYKMSYEAYSKKLLFRGATIVEMSFANNMMPALKAGMKKKAGNLNLDLSVADCF